MMIKSKQWERLDKVFNGQKADRTPVLGGWIACPEHICNIMGVTRDEYWNDKIRITIEAYKRLGMDGLIDVFVPISPDDYRFVDSHSYTRADSDEDFDEILEKIDAMPCAEEIEEKYDFEGEYNKFKDFLKSRQDFCGDMVFMQAMWGAGAKVSWYSDYGYENFFIIVGAYEEQAKKLMEVGGAYGKCTSKLIARAVTEGIYPKAVLLGEDICTQRGPMVNPAFLEKYYAPVLKEGLIPLLEVGCKPVWHCDGDVRPILDMIIDSGVKGLQGFQPECGLNIDFVAQKRTKEGNPLLIFGPMAVTTELPCLTTAEIRAKVRHAIDVCNNNADLVLFTSNTINPDVPLENIYAMYDAING